uniref:Putative secreted protein n=1 Tax=Anopheles triannulatus TaxID=58253 RepID=A0A2M4B0N9_9DIPT
MPSAQSSLLLYTFALFLNFLKFVIEAKFYNWTISFSTRPYLLLPPPPPTPSHLPRRTHPNLHEDKNLYPCGFQVTKFSPPAKAAVVGGGCTF